MFLDKKVTKELVRVNVGDLKPFPGNPRHNTKSAQIVAKSIKEFGYINPIIVTEDYVVLAGNTRLKALKILGAKEEDKIEVIMVRGLSEAEKRGFVIADNRVGEFSLWNYSALDRMVSEADNSEVSGTIKELGITSFAENKKELEALISGKGTKNE